MWTWRAASTSPQSSTRVSTGRCPKDATIATTASALARNSRRSVHPADLESDGTGILGQGFKLQFLVNQADPVRIAEYGGDLVLGSRAPASAPIVDVARHEGFARVCELTSQAHVVAGMIPLQKTGFPCAKSTDREARRCGVRSGQTRYTNDSTERARLMAT